MIQLSQVTAPKRGMSMLLGTASIVYVQKNIPDPKPYTVSVNMLGQRGRGSQEGATLGAMDGATACSSPRPAGEVGGGRGGVAGGGVHLEPNGAVGL